MPGKSKLRDLVIAEIRKYIRDRGLGTGDQLPTERELALAFGVSRTVVREALAGLEMAGMLELSPGRPPRLVAEYDRALTQTIASIVGGSAQALLDLAEARQIFEVEVAALAAARCRAEDLLELHAAQRAMRESIEQPSGYVTADLAFHGALVKASKNDVLAQLLRPMSGLLRQSREQSAWKRRSPLDAWEEHQRILERIEAGDMSGARAAMLVHMTSTRLDLSTALVSDEGRASSGRIETPRGTQANRAPENPGPINVAL
jgi:GntR family transcriptional regulator, transcriptional repressor for pyruvate dehydrogenase complex